ncbi:MAG: hypothetical protein V7K14_03695 [Nostoc sp.]|uniref:hypothetical protein n=1 Tax=Nostoc sp. TaxID=1180 RepID=UPI002FFC43B8
MNNFPGMEISCATIIMGYYWRGHAIEMYWNAVEKIWMYHFIYIYFSERGMPKEFLWWKGYDSIPKTRKMRHRGESPWSLLQECAEFYVNKLVEESFDHSVG